jgi:hypothetical protein
MKMSSNHSALKVTLSAAKLIAAPALMSAMMTVMVVGGCYAPQPTELYRTEKLPSEHWYTLDEDDSRVEALPHALRNSLTQQRQLVALEQGSENNSEDKPLSPETAKKVAELDQTCNDAYLISFDSIASNPTPDLNGQFESWDRRRQNDSMVYNQNFRALADEWSRFWLMEMPGGTPYDTVNTTGRF